VDKPDGHICYALIQSSQDQDDVRSIRNLQKTIYAQTDPNVVRYGLKTYVGKAVTFGGAIIGSLCVLYQNDHSLSEEDKKQKDDACGAGNESRDEPLPPIPKQSRDEEGHARPIRDQEQGNDHHADPQNNLAKVIRMGI
jgi:hypothetical protein